MVLSQYNQQMNVIRHDDIGIELISLFVEIVKSIGNYLTDLWIAQCTLSVMRIEFLFQWEDELAVVFDRLFR